MIVTSPRLEAEASGMLKVTPVVEVAMLKSVPAVPVANAKVVVERPLIEVVEKVEPEEIPSEDVATQRVDVPVVWRIIPAVPDALVESRKRPASERLVVVALVAVRAEIVVVARVADVVAVKVPATRLEVVALVAVRLVKNPVIAVKRLEKKLDDVALVVDALVAKKLVAVALVIRKLVEDPFDAKKVVAVALTVLKLVIVPVAEVSDEMVVVARVDVPVTPSVVPTTTAPDVVSAVADAVASTV